MISGPTHRSRLSFNRSWPFLTLLLPISLLVSAAQLPKSTPKPLAHFTDTAQKAGLHATEVFGGVNTKKYIIETTGTGVAIFDYDNDGWPDIFIVNGTNRDPTGPRITMKTGSRLFVDEVRSGSSYDSNSDMRVHFGLGSITKLDSIEIRWPSGLAEKLHNLAVDKIHTIKEGTGTEVKSDVRTQAVTP